MKTSVTSDNLLGDVEGAVVKWNYGFHSARTLTPAAAYRLIETTVRRALGRLDDFRPFVVATPVTLDVRFKSYRPAEVLAMLPSVERPDAHSIRYVGPDMPAVSRFIEFLTTYRVDLEP